MSEFKFDIGQHVNAKLYVGKVIARDDSTPDNKYLILDDTDVVYQHTWFYEDQLEHDKLNSNDFIMAKLSALWDKHQSLNFVDLFQMILNKKQINTDNDLIETIEEILNND